MLNAVRAQRERKVDQLLRRVNRNFISLLTGKNREDVHIFVKARSEFISPVVVRLKSLARSLSFVSIALGLLLSMGCALPQARESGRMGLLDALDAKSRGGAPVYSSQQQRTQKNQPDETRADHNLSETSPVARSKHRGLAFIGKKKKNPARVDVSAVTLNGWTWPLEHSHVISPYGKRGRSHFHDGLDLRAAEGTPIRSVADGEVIYVGERIKGYGKMVVVKHPKEGLFSIYAHLSQAEVAMNDRVESGELIALSGKTGRVSGAHLHFELRKGTKSIDPLLIMPREGVLLTQAQPRKSSRVRR